jgi:hypothetical protein
MKGVFVLWVIWRFISYNGIEKRYTALKPVFGALSFFYLLAMSLSRLVRGAHTIS